MIPPLPTAFLRAPIAHRALHDATDQRPENSLSAVRAAVNAGYGIEIDLQLSADGQALVFHDYTLERLTTQTGPVRDRRAAQAAQAALRCGSGEGIPPLSAVLEAVAGRVPLLIELKDQAHLPGGAVGPLEQASVDALQGYTGSVACMSFNPDSVAELARLAPDIPRGLTTCDFVEEEWPLTQAERRSLRDITDFERVGASFISHDHQDLSNPAVHRLRDAGVPILCWTIRSPQEEAQARRVADNVTFEGYAAPFPA